MSVAHQVVLDEAEKTWLACAIDGEGSIQLRFESRKGRSRPTPRVELSIVNTDRRFSEHARSLAGGYIRVNNQPSVERRGRRPIYEWRLSGHLRVGLILTAIRPFLVIKGEKADSVLDFINKHPWGKISLEGMRERTEKIRARWRDPVYRLRQSDNVRRLWRNPEHRALRIERIREGIASSSVKRHPH